MNRKILNLLSLTDGFSNNFQPRPSWHPFSSPAHLTLLECSSWPFPSVGLISTQLRASGIPAAQLQEAPRPTQSPPFTVSYPACKMALTDPPLVPAVNLHPFSTDWQGPWLQPFSPMGAPSGTSDGIEGADPTRASSSLPALIVPRWRPLRKSFSFLSLCFLICEMV